MFTQNMRKANYDKFPSTKMEGTLIQGWDGIVPAIAKASDGPVVVELYTGVYEEDVFEAFGKVFDKVIDTRDLMFDENKVL